MVERDVDATARLREQLLEHVAFMRRCWPNEPEIADDMEAASSLLPTTEAEIKELKLRGAARPVTDGAGPTPLDPSSVPNGGDSGQRHPVKCAICGNSKMILTGTLCPDCLIASNLGDPGSIAQQSVDAKPFVDTPVLAARRRAFDNPTIANLDALIQAAEAKCQTTEAPLVTYMTTDSPLERDMAFLSTCAARLRDGAAAAWEIPNTVACTLEDIVKRQRLRCQTTKAERDEKKPKREKHVHIGAPACFALELAIRPIIEAFGVYSGAGILGCYLVGSVLERADWRDVDVRLMMDDATFAREFPLAGEHWENDARWLLLTVSISEYLAKRTGLPIDFQFQPMTRTNARHKGKRNAIGISFSKESA